MVKTSHYVPDLQTFEVKGLWNDRRSNDYPPLPPLTYHSPPLFPETKLKTDSRRREVVVGTVDVGFVVRTPRRSLQSREESLQTRTGVRGGLSRFVSRTSQDGTSRLVLGIPRRRKCTDSRPARYRKKEKRGFGPLPSRKNVNN